MVSFTGISGRVDIGFSSSASLESDPEFELLPSSSGAGAGAGAASSGTGAGTGAASSGAGAGAGAGAGSGAASSGAGAGAGAGAASSGTGAGTGGGGAISTGSGIDGEFSYPNSLVGNPLCLEYVTMCFFASVIANSAASIADNTTANSLVSLFVFSVRLFSISNFKLEYFVFKSPYLF